MELDFKIKMEFLNKSILSSRSSDLDNQQGEIYLTGKLDTHIIKVLTKKCLATNNVLPLGNFAQRRSTRHVGLDLP